MLELERSPVSGAAFGSDGGRCGSLCVKDELICSLGLGSLYVPAVQLLAKRKYYRQLVIMVMVDGGDSQLHLK